MSTHRPPSALKRAWDRVRLTARQLLGRSDLEAEMDEEIRFHIDAETESNIASGMTPTEARRSALIAFGGVERFKEQGREQRGGRAMEDAWRDVRRAFRRLRKNPAFTLVALAMLALGIGANTAIFSVVSAVLFQPLPYHQPDQLVEVYESHLERGWDRFSFSQPNALDLTRQATAFDGMAAYGGTQGILTGGDQPQQIDVGTVSPGFFGTLGVSLLLGRDFSGEDLDANRAKPVIILGEDLWRTRFGADPAVVGTSVDVEGEAYAIVGVAPRGSFWLFRDAYIPLALSLERNREDHRWAMIGRLREGTSVATAQSELDAIAVRMEQANGGEDEGLGFLIDPASTWAASENLRTTLWVFLGASGLLLLIACMNVANLHLAKLGARSKQVMVCQALGAGRSRILRELATEATVMGLIGSVLGVGVAHFGLRVLVAMEPGNIPRLADATISGPVLAFGIALGLAASLGSGLLPAARGLGTSLATALRNAGGRTSGGAAGSRARAWLVGAETAISLVLLIGAGLLVRSLIAVQSVDNGFDSEGRITFEVPLPQTYAMADGEAFKTEFLERMRNLPSVDDAAAVSLRPVGGGNTVMGILPANETGETFGGIPTANWRAVSDQYFETLGLALTTGGDLSHQREAAEVVLSAALAQTLWGTEDPVGKQVDLWADPDRRSTVIGVVENMRERGPETGETLAVYFSYTDVPWTPINFVVHASGSTEAVIGEVRAILNDIDPDLPLSRVLTMDAMLENSTASRTFTMTLLSVFAGLAVVLALAGLYGVIAQSIGQRTKELGIRSALGATTGEIVRLVMKQGMRPALIGIVVGLFAAGAFSRALQALVFEVQSTDPTTYVAVGILLALASAAACWIPAQATTRLETSSVLRDE